jgi:hypothetical protein
LVGARRSDIALEMLSNFIRFSHQAGRKSIGIGLRRQPAIITVMARRWSSPLIA